MNRTPAGTSLRHLVGVRLLILHPQHRLPGPVGVDPRELLDVALGEELIALEAGHALGVCGGDQRVACRLPDERHEEVIGAYAQRLARPLRHGG